MAAISYPDIRIYGADGARKAFPVDQVASVEWEHLALGGFGQCTVTFKEDFGTALTVAAGDRLEVWVRGTLRYRGCIAMAELGLDLADRKTLTAYGLAERMNSVLTNKRYLDAAGKNAAQLAQYLWQDWVSPIIASTATRFETCPTTIYDLTCKGTAREAFDALIESSGNDCVWGWEVNAAGQDQLYVIPRAATPAYKFIVGKNVKSFSYPEDHTAIVNTVHVFGAKSKWPNLLPNPSFDELDYASEENGNVIGNESFEDWSGTTLKSWTLFGAVKKTDIARTGKISIGIDHANYYIRQSRIPVSGSKLHWLCFYLNRASGQASVTLPFIDVTITFDSGGPIFLTFPQSGADPPWVDGVWNRMCRSFTPPANATKAELTILLNRHVSELRLDDVALWEEGKTACPGWKADTVGAYGTYWSGSCPVAWGAAGKPAEREHGHCATVTLRPTQARTSIAQPFADALAVQPGDAVKGYCYGRTSAGTCKATMFQLCYDDDGLAYIDKGAEVTLNSTAWTQFNTGIQAGLGPGITTVRVGIQLYNDTGSDAEVYLDSAYELSDPQHAWDRLNPPYFPDYIRGDTYEWWFSTDDSFVQSDGAISAAVKQSIATFGIRQAEETVDYLDSLEAAQAWAKRYFGRHAMPTTPQRLELVGCTDDVRCDGPVQVIGSGKAAAFPLRVTHKLRAGADSTDVTIELDALRPSWEGLLSGVLTAAEKKAKLAMLR